MSSTNTVRRLRGWKLLAGPAGGLALIASVSAADGNLPLPSPVPGGVAVICVGRSTDPAPRAEFDGRRVLVARAGEGWHAVVGLPLTLQPGAYELSVLNAETGSRKIRFEVGSRDYDTQRLTLANRRQVDPEPADLLRINREQESISRAFSTFSDVAIDALTLDLPSVGRFSSGFGLRRFFNNELRQPHSGLDIAAAEGTPILAPAAATVLETGDYFFNGLTIFLDHGQGLVTMYNHLSRIDVVRGARVARREKVGEVGHTGRVTGAHLHWSVSLNNARVDPGLFLPVSIREQVPTGLPPKARSAGLAPASPLGCNS